jgi:hypothetical protein
LHLLIELAYAFFAGEGEAQGHMQLKPKTSSRPKLSDVQGTFAELNVDSSSRPSH